MSKNSRSNILSVLARIVLAFVFVFGQSAWAIQAQNPKDKPSSNAAAQPKQAPANGSTAAGAKAQSGEETASAENSSNREDSRHGGPQEGIKVHGHWTIEVRNPDGSVATHREFENSLAGPASLLPPILSRTTTVGLWTVLLDGTAGGPCSSGGCQVSEAGSPSFSSYVASYNLQVSTAGIPLSGGAERTQFILTGTATALASSGINQVRTAVTYCPNTIAPGTVGVTNSCGNNSEFTLAILATPIQVSSGQTIAVTVNISFS
jgi:hypothetical protein